LEIICSLSNGYVGNNLGRPLTPQTTPVSTCCVAFHIFIVGECRDFKFDVQVEHSKSQPMNDKLWLKRTWSHHVTHFKFLVPLKYLEWLKLETSNFVHWLVMWSISLQIDK